MKNKTVMYYIINVVFLLIAILLVNYAGIMDMNFKMEQLILLMLLFITIHVFKFIRIYFILLEERISIRRMVKIYIKTTFVSIVLPYKTGELYKMYSYGNEIKNYPKGIISILIDKFFDAIILCALLIPYEIATKSNISKLALIMLAFIIVVAIIYLSFEGTYYYLNKFCVIKGKSKRSLFILNVLEKSHDVYKSAKEMLRGRQLVLLFLTAIIWMTESISIYIMAEFMNIKVEIMTIINYISDAFFGINNILFNNYIYLCTAIFLAIIVYIYIKKIIEGGRILWKK